MPAGSPDISMVSPWPGPPLSGLLQPCDRPLVLAGAGVSASCGLPTGVQLGRWLRQQDFAADVDFSRLDEQCRGTHPGYVASYILDADPSRRAEMLQAIATHIESAQSHASYSRVVQALAATPVGVVLTFNYDTLLEEAAREKEREALSLGLDDVPELIADGLVEPDGRLRVVHLHGVVDDPDSLVIDHHSYMRAASDAHVRELFIAMVTNHNLCAIGTQLEEDYLAAVMLGLRPSRPRHVIVCGLDQAERVRNDDATFGVGRHHWLPCAYLKDERQVLEPFCELLVTCKEPPPAEGPIVTVGQASVDAVYARRRLLARDEIEEDSQLSPELQLEFDMLSAHGEESLVREQLSIVVGPPGSGKTRLMQEMASRGGAERALFLRLREVRDVLGEPQLLLGRWLEQARVLEGDPIGVEDILAGRTRAWLLLDGLDEVPLDRRAAVAETIERLARAYPQHRFTVTSRPVSALADLSAVWRVFDLVCDDRWRSDFLRVNEVDEQEFWAALGPAAPSLRSLLRIPFFLRGAVELRDAGEDVGDAMQISLALLARSLRADEQLAVLGDRPRRWLTKVALLQQLSGAVAIGEEALQALSAEEDLGDVAVLTDLLASRSLLAHSGERWGFSHRLFGEALAAEYLLDEDPAHWLDSLAPEVDGWSAVLDQWSAPLRMTLTRSADWRREIGRRDPLFAARATPRDAPAGERLEAASLLWRHAAEWDVWVEPHHLEVGSVVDGEVVAELVRAGGLEDLVEEIGAALEVPSRFVRGNAVDVLAAIPAEDVGEVLAAVLEDDEDPVVRRSAATAARRLGLTKLAEPVIRRAMAPQDASEAADMAAVAIKLSPRERRLAVATEIAAAGNAEARDHLVLTDVPLPDRVAWLRQRAGTDLARSFSLARGVARVVAEAQEDPDEAPAEELGYLAALVRSRDTGVLDFVASREEAVRGVLQALEQEEVSAWEIPRLLNAVGREALEGAGAGEEVLSALGPRAVGHEREVLEPEVAEDGGVTEDDSVSIAPALAWEDEADLRAAVNVSGGRATIDDWAAAVLTFGPQVEMPLDDERWVQVATCGWLFGPQLGWLAAQASQPRLDRAAEATASVKVLTDLLRIGGHLDVSPIGRRLEEADLSEAGDAALAAAGVAMRAAAGRDALVSLAAAGPRWHAALRRELAAAGVLDAQLAELADLAQHLRSGGRSDSLDLSWLQGIGDPRALPALHDALIAAGRESDDAPPRFTLSALRSAIEAIGGVEAVQLLDRIAREPSYPGAQFLLEDRDRLLQSVLGLSARAAARSLADSLQLPFEAADPAASPALRVLGRIGARLREALEGMSFPAPATAFGARLDPVSVRGGEMEESPAPRVARAQVSLDDAAASVLGDGARASALLAGGYVKFWLSGLSAVEVGASIQVTAIRPDGRAVNADAEVVDGARSLEFELAWPFSEPPGEIAVAVIAA